MLSFELNNLGDNVLVADKYGNHDEFTVRGNRAFAVFKWQQPLGFSGLELYSVHYAQNFLATGDVSTCFDLRPGHWNWFGGPAQRRQYWPVEKLQLQNCAYVPQTHAHANVMERYWLNSMGMFVYVPEIVPLFVDQNGSQLCMSVKDEHPYNMDPMLDHLEFVVGIGLNARDTHVEAIFNYLGQPQSRPDEMMIKYPIWSTKARYGTNVNATAVFQLANEIDLHGFNGSHIEIDDNWEQCYGTMTFDADKFPNIRNLTNELRLLGYRTTLWVHPFINKACKFVYSEARLKE